jgi:CRP/FNR family cyclic AMP-dependent transcriptional regulator
MIEVTASSLATHPFLYGMSRSQLWTLADAASAVRFPARYRLFEEGGNASRFWLIQSGHVALDAFLPGDGRMVIENIGIGEMLGWSWLFPPYQWTSGAVTVVPVQAFQFDGPVVRSCCAADPELGYELGQRMLRVMAGRLRVTRDRLVVGCSGCADHSVR